MAVFLFLSFSWSFSPVRVLVLVFARVPVPVHVRVYVRVHVCVRVPGPVRVRVPDPCLCPFPSPWLFRYPFPCRVHDRVRVLNLERLRKKSHRDVDRGGGGDHQQVPVRVLVAHPFNGDPDGGHQVAYIYLEEMCADFRAHFHLTQQHPCREV